MKSLWNNFKVAFAMFSKIPMPRADWTKENMKYMFCFFPFIGTVIGILTMVVAWLGLRFGYEPGFVTVVLVLIPVLVTGGIHVDGLLDTSDALSSWQERSPETGDPEGLSCRGFCGDHCSRVFSYLAGGFQSALWKGKSSCHRNPQSWIYGFQVSVRNWCDHLSQGKSRWHSSAVFQKFFGCGIQKCIDLLSGTSSGRDDVDSPCMGTGSLCGSFAGILVLSSYGNEIFRRNHRRSVWLFPLPL